MAGMEEDPHIQDLVSDTVMEQVDGRYVIANGTHAKGVVAGMHAGRSFAGAFTDTVGSLEAPLTTPKLAGAFVVPDGFERKALGGYEFSLARGREPVAHLLCRLLAAC